MQAQTLCSLVRREFKTQSEDKPDMIEANATYLWRRRSGIDVSGLSASGSVPSIHNIHADMGISVPVLVFSFSVKTI